MFDERDSQPRSFREAALFSDFPQRLKQAVQDCPGLAAHLDGCSLDTVIDRSSLQTLPVLRKSTLMAAQQKSPPFGGFVKQSSLEGARVFMSPGPVWEPQLPGTDPWQAARALHAAGIERGHRIHNAFSYHLTPGGFILDEGARAIGCTVFPAGVGGTEMQVQAIRHFQAQVYVGTPDYLQVLLDHGVQENQPLSSIKRALVSGGALFPTLREHYREQGIHVQQCYATADLGVVAYETATMATVHPGMCVNEGLIVEILIPGTDTPVPPGQVGEVVVTRLNSHYPLVRFATGDLSAELQEPSPCGRTQMRLAGWMGRADQRVKVRGMFVDPVQLKGLRDAWPQVDRWRLVIDRRDGRDEMTLQTTLRTDHEIAGDSLHQGVLLLADALKSATGLTGTVELVESLPDDGIVVDDQRDYENG